MSVIFPLLYLSLIILAIVICEWRVVLAFFIVVISFPFIFGYIDYLFNISSSEIELEYVWITGWLFAAGGLPIYIVFMMPAYYLLKRISSISLFISFPVTVVSILLILAAFIITKEWNYIVFLVITGCGICHSLSILGLIHLFNRWRPGSELVAEN